MDAALAARLQDLVKSEGRSLLQYVSESFPWTAAHDEQARTAVLGFARAEAEALARLVRHLQKIHVGVPHLGPYPMSFTTVNFVSLGYLLPRLAQEQKTHIAQVERLCNALPDGETKNLVGELLILKKQHLSQLNAFTASLPPPSLAS
jgi:hypothetical protein